MSSGFYKIAYLWEEGLEQQSFLNPGRGAATWNICRPWRLRVIRLGTFFVIQRHDAEVLRPAADIITAYARALAAGVAVGVNLMVLQEKINPSEISLASILPFDLT